MRYRRNHGFVAVIKVVHVTTEYDNGLACAHGRVTGEIATDASDELDGWCT